MIVKLSPINQGFPAFDIVNLFTMYCDKEYVFLDIETTGFAPGNSQLYLIGCLNFSENSWSKTQWLAETFDEEERILQNFLNFLPKNFCLITFNGTTFDLPYLQQKIRQFGLESVSPDLDFFDLYKVLKPYKQLLNFSHFRQSDLESFIGFPRTGDTSGKKCITIYQQFLRTQEVSLAETLLAHNETDLLGMKSILPVLNYAQLPLGQFQLQSFRREEGYLFAELLLFRPLPRPLEFSDSLMRCSGADHALTVVLPLADGKLRKFYANYQDYAYLPGEDMAIHKSLASCLPRDRKKKATARTCYTWFDSDSALKEHPDLLRQCLMEYFRLLVYGHLTIP